MFNKAFPIMNKGGHFQVPRCYQQKVQQELIETQNFNDKNELKDGDWS